MLPLKPWLWLPSELSHKISPWALKLITLARKPQTPEYRPFSWRGLDFKNPLGIAGGVDKTGHSLASWWCLGPGFIEIGTVTPQPQGPNPGKIMDRDISQKALWNKMGFPNLGCEAAKKQLSTLKKPYPTPLFVNIGKNRWTENEKAHEDYLYCLENLKSFADVFVVNISSPNTSGLRDLQQGEEFQKLLKTLSDFKQQNNDQPVLLKLSPDMSNDQLKELLEASFSTVDGWILTNTTVSQIGRAHV